MIFLFQDIRGSIPYAIANDAPPGWKELPSLPMGRVFRRETSSLTVLSSLDRMSNDSFVLHISVSRKSRLPSWEDLKCVKNVFMGRDVDAFHVIPKASDHVNLHNYTMHIWTPWKEACLTN